MLTHIDQKPHQSVFRQRMSKWFTLQNHLCSFYSKCAQLVLFLLLFILTQPAVSDISKEKKRSRVRIMIFDTAVNLSDPRISCFIDIETLKSIRLDKTLKLQTSAYDIHQLAMGQDTHGTHVAVNLLSGLSCEDYELIPFPMIPQVEGQLFDEPWIQAMIKIAPGFRFWDKTDFDEEQRKLYDQSNDELVKLIQELKIELVNMSIGNHRIQDLPFYLRINKIVRSQVRQSSWRFQGLADQLQNVLFVAASGNFGKEMTPDDCAFRCQQSNVLIVSTFDSKNGRLAKYSNYSSDYVDVAAVPHRGVVPDELEGTSYSTPLITRQLLHMMRDTQFRQLSASEKKLFFLEYSTVPTESLVGKIKEGRLLPIHFRAHSAPHFKASEYAEFELELTQIRKVVGLPQHHLKRILETKLQKNTQLMRSLKDSKAKYRRIFVTGDKGKLILNGLLIHQNGEVIALDSASTILRELFVRDGETRLVSPCDALLNVNSKN